MSANPKKSKGKVFALIFAALMVFFYVNRSANAAIIGDINGDGRVDVLDFQLLSNSFGKSSDQTGYNPLANLNNDGSVDILDFQILSNNFGTIGTTATPTVRPNISSGPTVTSAPIPTLPSSPNIVVDKNNIGGNGCSDSGQGSLSQPFCTVNKAISVANPGTIIAVRGGTYPPFQISKSGTSGNYITITAYGNERPHVQGGSEGIGIIGRSYIRIVGFEVSGASGGYSGGGIYLGNGAYNNIIERNITHHNSGGFTSGINVNASSNNKILNNTSYNNGLKGIRIAQGGDNQIIGNLAYSNTGNGGGSDGITTTEGSRNNLIKDNVVHNNSDDGIDCWSSHGNTIIGNVAYDNLGPGDGNGFKMGGTETGGQHLVTGNLSYNNKRDGFDSNHSYGNTYYNNTAVGNGGVGFRDIDKFPNCIYSNCKTIYVNNIGYNNNKNFAASPHTEVSHNNIWYSDSGGASVTYQGSSTFSTLSSFYQATGNRLDNPNAGELSSLSLNPSFVNVSGRNFRLNSGSPAINKGDSSNPGDIPAVGVPDIGAFEFGL